MEGIVKGLDAERIELNNKLVNKVLYSQYLTPVSIAKFMGSLFDKDSFENAQVLDAGAGIGTLSLTLLDMVIKESSACKDNIHLTLVELDELLSDRIEIKSTEIKKDLNIKLEIINDDFVKWAAREIQDSHSLFQDTPRLYTHIVLNPPYQKLRNKSIHKEVLKDIGIDTVNLYTAFVALAIKLLKEGGQLIAIIPRSFCNGPYYKKFRELILSETEIHHIHLFESRNKAFEDDKVLQENIIIKLVKGRKQGDVTVSVSTDSLFNDYKQDEYHFNSIVREEDLQSFINIPTSKEKLIYEKYPTVRYTLEELGINVSTGPVVGYRIKDYLCNSENAIPMLYSKQISNGKIVLENERKKPKGILRNETTQKWLYPNGYYLMMRRRTTKEEAKRIISTVIRPEEFSTNWLGFDNGLNILHFNKKGLHKYLAFGLHAYMNSSLFDEYFRLFSGNTQVNATDLRTMYYPSREKLEEIGEWYLTHEEGLTQKSLDIGIGEIL